MSAPKNLVASAASWQLPDLRGRWLLRIYFAACQGAAIGLTLNLWAARPGRPPNLPLIDAAWVDGLQFGFGWPLLASLVLAVIWPYFGVTLHIALLVLAIGFDQLRIQPEFVSVALLLAGTLPRRGPMLLARCHLVSLWCFAGMHKLLSPEYWQRGGPELAQMLLPWLDGNWAVAAGILIACGELGTGIMAVVPRSRRYVPWTAAALHGGILLSLVVDWWNSAVWPWNLALAAAGWGFFAGWKGPFLSLDTEPLAAAVPTAAPSAAVATGNLWQRRLWQVAAILTLLHPALFYVDRCDAYVAWCVYSSNTPEGTYYESVDFSAVQDDPLAPLSYPVGDELLFLEYKAINVPFPPIPRLYRQYLRRVGKPGDLVIVDDPRLWSRWRGRGKMMLLKRSDGTVVERVFKGG